jgi:hypothetical protein
MCIKPNIPDTERENREGERLNDLAEHASTDTNLFGTLASWLRELLDEGRQA